MRNVTLFAPTNDALKNRSLTDPELQIWLEEDASSLLQDNLQYRLRERLFYHMLNYTGELSFPDPMYQGIAYESTLLFPTTHEEHGRPGHVPYPAPRDTLLGGEGQKLPATRKDGKLVKLAVAQDGSGGANVLDNRGGTGRNGQVKVIDGLLEPPHSVGHILKARSTHGDKADQNSLSKFAGLLDDKLWKTMHEGSHITLFAPQDKAFDVLEPLEWKYLQSGFAADDILEIANNHRTEYHGEEARREKVGYLDRLLSVKNGRSAIYCFISR
jgi:solute carrier family 25 carnitine/acylcarnitine transporter 20/29